MRIFLVLCICSLSFLYADSVEELQSANVQVRTAAILKIGQHHTQDNFEILYRHFSKMNIMEKKAYMQVLGKWRGDGCDQAMAILINTLLSKDSREVRREAALGLGEMAKIEQSSSDKDSQKRLNKITQSLKKSLVRTQDSYQVREDIIAAFGIIGSLDHIKILSIGLKDSYKGVRIKAAEMFLKLNASEHVDILIKHCQRETQVPVQSRILEVLAELNKEKSFSLFEKVLTNRRSDNQIRQKMAEIMGEYSSETYEKLHKRAIKALAKSFPNEKDQTLRVNIIKSLAKFDTSSPDIQKIYKMAKKDKKAIRELAQQLLEK